MEINTCGRRYVLPVVCKLQSVYNMSKPLTAACMPAAYSALPFIALASTSQSVPEEVHVKFYSEPQLKYQPHSVASNNEVK